jgi:hypothetical protein
MNLPKTCGACHAGPFVAFQESRHFALLQAGTPWSPRARPVTARLARIARRQRHWSVNARAVIGPDDPTSNPNIRLWVGRCSKAFARREQC